MRRSVVFSLLFLVLIVATSGATFRSIVYKNEPTLDLPVGKINKKVIYDNVEKKEVNLYQYLSAEGYPIYYSRNVQTGVCYDNQCKPLNITLYWNPTGRYLGFELPENEFLSKDDHEPFTEAEYIRLNQLLSDPKLPLGEFTYSQIAAKNRASLYSIDGVSGATAPDVLEYVIRGSAYTTYTIYELVYGNTQSEVETWTDQLLDDAYLSRILNQSPHPDKLWAIDLVRGRFADFPKAKELALDLLDSADYSLTEKYINSLVAQDLANEEFQNRLIDKFSSFDFGLKIRTIELLRDAPQLSNYVIESFNHRLHDMEVPLVAGILDVYKERGVSDPATLKTIKGLAASNNMYLEKKIKSYIDSI